MRKLFAAFILVASIAMVGCSGQQEAGADIVGSGNKPSSASQAAGTAAAPVAPGGAMPDAGKTSE